MEEPIRVKVSHSLGRVAGDFHPQIPWYFVVAENELFQTATLDVLRDSIETETRKKKKKMKLIL